MYVSSLILTEDFFVPYGYNSGIRKYLFLNVFGNLFYIVISGPTNTE